MSGGHRISVFVRMGNVLTENVYVSLAGPAVHVIGVRKASLWSPLMILLIVLIVNVRFLYFFFSPLLTAPSM